MVSLSPLKKVSVFSRPLGLLLREAAYCYLGCPLVIRRLEPNNPSKKMHEFVGTVNETTVFARDRPHTWMCIGVEGIRCAGHWEVTSTFRYNSDTWDLRVAAVGDCVDPRDIKTVSPYQERDFFDMGITVRG